MKSQNSEGGVPLLMLGSSRRGCLGVEVFFITEITASMRIYKKAGKNKAAGPVKVEDEPEDESATKVE